MIRLHETSGLSERLDEAKMLAAKVLINQLAGRGILPKIQDAEFKVFSQFGEDGIIQYLVRIAEVPHNAEIFVEFGVESYSEANTRFLLQNNNWRGLVIDGSKRNIDICKSAPIFWKYDLTAFSAFVDAENINKIIGDAGFKGEIGILSIDLDGNDYWVWEKVNAVNPIIVVCEFNSLFGARHAVTIPYDPAFRRTQSHYSNLYFGCSLKALELLGKKKGYALVGTNSNGSNAFFVRRDHLNGLVELSAEEAYVESRFRESRGVNGRLTYLRGTARLDAICDMDLYDIERDEVLPIRTFIE